MSIVSSSEPGSNPGFFLAALLLAFFALLRVSDHTTPTKGAWFDIETHASRGDIQFIPSLDDCQHVVFTVKVAKNDQHRRA